jgi:hypothetical protein
LEDGNLYLRYLQTFLLRKVKRDRLYK